MCAAHQLTVGAGLPLPGVIGYDGCPQTLGLHFLPVMAGDIMAAPDVLELTAQPFYNRPWHRGNGYGNDTRWVD